MDKRDTISIIVPVYNCEKYLPECIESIINQTYTELEIIFINDGSTDKSGWILSEYSRRDLRIKIISSVNKGVSVARNIGISASKGEYIAFVDADDVISRYYIENLYTAIDEYNADVVICGITREIELLLEDDTHVNAVLTGTDVIRKLDVVSYITVWNRLYKRYIWDELRFPPGKINEDVFMAHKIFLQAKSVAVIDEPLYYYRDTDNSIMKSKKGVRNLDELEGVYERFCDLKSKGYEELLDDVLKSARKGIEYYKYCLGVKGDERKRRNEVIKMYRYMLKNAPSCPPLQYRIIGCFPSLYFGLKRVLRR